jgi:hypothetical protein
MPRLSLPLRVAVLSIHCWPTSNIGFYETSVTQRFLWFKTNLTLFFVKRFFEALAFLIGIQMHAVIFLKTTIFTVNFITYVKCKLKRTAFFWYSLPIKRVSHLKLRNDIFGAEAGYHTFWVSLTRIICQKSKGGQDLNHQPPEPCAMMNNTPRGSNHCSGDPKCSLSIH